MFTLEEIYIFIARNIEGDTLNEYYNKSYETLQELIKRSNVITIFILTIFALFTFRDDISTEGILGFTVHKNVITILSPLLLSYFIFEWCLIARRRRELMKIMKHIGFHIFTIEKVPADFSFVHFGLHSRNVLPFSFLIEFINLDIQSRFHRFIIKYSIRAMFFMIISYIGYCLYVSMHELSFSIPVLISIVISFYFLLQIILFYKNEFKLRKEILARDQEFESGLELLQSDTANV